MKPLGYSLFQLTAGPPMHEAGGRLFVDVSRQLASPAVRAGLLHMIATGDPLTGDALKTVIDREFIATEADGAPAGPPPGAAAPEPIATDPAIVEELIAHNEASVAALARGIQGKTGAALLDFILVDIPEMKRVLFDPRSYGAFVGRLIAPSFVLSAMAPVVYAFVIERAGQAGALWLSAAVAACVLAAALVLKLRFGSATTPSAR